MGLLFLIPFFIVLAIYVIYSKDDLYSHQHNRPIREEIEKFNANYKELENLDINNNYVITNNHLYNNK